MSTAEILEACRAAGITLSMNGDRLHFLAPAGMPPVLRERLVIHKAELLDLLREAACKRWLAELATCLCHERHELLAAGVITTDELPDYSSTDPQALADTLLALPQVTGELPATRHLLYEAKKRAGRAVADELHHCRDAPTSSGARC